MSTAKKLGLKLGELVRHGSLELKLKLDEPASCGGLAFQVTKANSGAARFTLTIRDTNSSCPEGREPPQSPQPA